MRFFSSRLLHSPIPRRAAVTLITPVALVWISLGCGHKNPDVTKSGDIHSTASDSDLAKGDVANSVEIHAAASSGDLER